MDIKSSHACNHKITASHCTKVRPKYEKYITAPSLVAVRGSRHCMRWRLGWAGGWGPKRGSRGSNWISMNHFLVEKAGIVQYKVYVLSMCSDVGQWRRYLVPNYQQQVSEIFNMKRTVFKPRETFMILRNHNCNTTLNQTRSAPRGSRFPIRPGGCYGDIGVAVIRVELASPPCEDTETMYC